MIYPLLWMVFSSFKQTNTIFTSAGQLLPDEWVLTNYQTGWRGFAGISFGVYFRNSFFICILSTLGVLLLSLIHISSWYRAHRTGLPATRRGAAMQ